MSEYTCDRCNKTYSLRNDDEWNDKKAAEEFLELYPECKNSSTGILCETCYAIFKDWFFSHSEDERKRMIEGISN